MTNIRLESKHDVCHSGEVVSMDVAGMNTRFHPGGHIRTEPLKRQSHKVRPDAFAVTQLLKGPREPLLHMVEGRW